MDRDSGLRRLLLKGVPRREDEQIAKRLLRAIEQYLFPSTHNYLSSPVGQIEKARFFFFAVDYPYPH